MSDTDKIELLDPPGARALALDINTIATKIDNIFMGQEDSMNNLFGQNWQSDGSSQAKADDLKRFGAKYDGIVKMIIAASNTVITATDYLESGDRTAGEVMENGG